MSIRIAMVLFGVCAGICVHASSVFSPGDVFPYEVSGSEQLPERTRTGVFFAGAQAAHSPDFAVDPLLSRLRGSDPLPGTSYTPPAEIPTVESALFFTKQGARLKVTAGAPALERDAPGATYYDGIAQPLDLALFNGPLHSPALPTTPATEATARLLRIDLTSDTRGGHAWGRRFRGLTVANGKLPGCVYTNHLWPPRSLPCWS